MTQPCMPAWPARFPCRTTLAQPALLRALALACALLVAAGCRRNASQELAEGERLLSLDQAGKALAQFQAALARQPSARAHRGAGLAEEALKSYVAAREHLQAAVDANPKDIQSRLGLVRIATRLRRFDTAREQLEALMTLAPKEQEVVLLQALYAEGQPALSEAAQRVQALPRTQESLIVTADLARRLQLPGGVRGNRNTKLAAPMHSERQSVRLAIAAYQLERFEVSAALLEAVLSRNPHQPSAERWLIRTYLRLDEPRKARLAVARLPPGENDPALALLRAQVLLANDQVVPAEKGLQELLQGLAPGARYLQGEARLTLADALERLGKRDAAERLWAELLLDPLHQKPAWLSKAAVADASSCPSTIAAAAKLQSHHLSDPAVLLQLGRCQLLGNDRKQAMASLAPLQLLPAYAAPTALLLLTNGDPHPAEPPASSAILAQLAQHTQHAASWRSCLRWLRRGKAAQGQLRKQLEALLPDAAATPEVHAMYARWLAYGGEHHAARERLRSVLSAQPDQATAAQSLAALYRVLGKPALAHGVLDSATSANPRSLPLRLTAAWALAELGDGAASQKQLEAAESYDPGHPRIHALWALVAAELQQDLASARQHLAIAQAADPKAADTLDAQGWLMHLEGHSKAALPWLKAAVEEQPLNALFHYHLGAALLGLSDRRAEQELKAATELDPFFYRRDDVSKVLTLTQKNSQP